MKKIAAIAIALVLCACAHDEVPRPTGPVIQTQRVEVPVAVPCKVEKPDHKPFPDTPDKLTAEQDWGKQAQLLAEGWPLREDYIRSLEAAFAACGKGVTAAPVQ